MADIIIVGAGPAGLSAAVYARRAGMDTVLYEAEMYGGQIVNTPEVENYPAIAKISGFDFAIIPLPLDTMRRRSDSNYRRK